MSQTFPVIFTTSEVNFTNIFKRIVKFTLKIISFQKCAEVPDSLGFTINI